jgi:hypothetical protein
VSKIGSVVEEGDESAFWLEFAGRAKLTESGEHTALARESRELLAIFIQSWKTASSHVARR